MSMNATPVSPSVASQSAPAVEPTATEAAVPQVQATGPVDTIASVATPSQAAPVTPTPIGKVFTSYFTLSDFFNPKQDINSYSQNYEQRKGLSLLAATIMTPIKMLGRIALGALFTIGKIFCLPCGGMVAHQAKVAKQDRENMQRRMDAELAQVSNSIRNRTQSAG